jgi:UDP-N-acetylmuramoyl-L-alanyl-D-glutamate--2,6-diaminopimelate ligase
VALSQLKPVEGRFNLIKGKEGVHAIVDFAHTPDALSNVYQAIEQLRTRNERLITVVGCGGNRDQNKRPEMGKIAAQSSDIVVFTSDNPRDEDPMAIIDQMNAGVAVEHTQKILIQPDRYQAIKMAMRMAQPNDIVLIAGKGHERYQEIKGERFEFDDVKTVKELINA